VPKEESFDNGIVSQKNDICNNYYNLISILTVGWGKPTITFVL